MRIRVQGIQTMASVGGAAVEFRADGFEAVSEARTRAIVEGICPAERASGS